MTEPESVKKARRRLEHAEAELREVAQEGEEREPLLQRLENHLHDNGFAERFVAGVMASRRRQA